MTLRFLVIEGNERQTRAEHSALAGITPAESYARVVQGIEADCVCDIVCPADADAALPEGASLAGYDGIFLTGSALHIYDNGPSIQRQINLMRAVYASGTPAFGSCWGLQIGAVAAGGVVARNPSGREAGVARNLTPTRAGRDHPLLQNRPLAYDAPAVHLDAVMTAPPDCIILAANGTTQIQAAEIYHNGGMLWGVQYHPEYGLSDLAVILERLRTQLLEEGFCRTQEAVDALILDFKTLHEDPSRFDIAWRYGFDNQVVDPVLRTTEIRAFLDVGVKRPRLV